MDLGLILLRLAHIVAGAAWVGGAFVMILLVTGTARLRGADGDAFMTTLLTQGKARATSRSPPSRRSSPAASCTSAPRADSRLNGSRVPVGSVSRSARSPRSSRSLWGSRRRRAGRQAGRGDRGRRGSDRWGSLRRAHTSELDAIRRKLGTFAHGRSALLGHGRGHGWFDLRATW